MNNTERLEALQQELGIDTYGEWWGVETFGFSLDNWKHTIETLDDSAKPDVLYIKYGEAGQEWYGTNAASIYDLCLSAGIGCVPYVFCRPNTVDADLVLIEKLFALKHGDKTNNIIALNCEEQWVGHDGALHTLINVIRRDHPEAVILVVGYGDPITAVPAWNFGAIQNATGYQPEWYIGYWTVYQQRGVQAAINWADAQCLTQFQRFGLGADFPIAPLISPEQMKSEQDILDTVQYCLNWKCGVALWEAREISPELRVKIKALVKQHAKKVSAQSKTVRDTNGQNAGTSGENSLRNSQQEGAALSQEETGTKTEQA